MDVGWQASALMGLAMEDRMNDAGPHEYLDLQLWVEAALQRPLPEQRAANEFQSAEALAEAPAERSAELARI